MRGPGPRLGRTALHRRNCLARCHGKLSSAICCSAVPSCGSSLSTSSGTNTQKRMMKTTIEDFRNGENTRYLPLCDRKLRLRSAVPKDCERLLYCDHIDGDSEDVVQPTDQGRISAQVVRSLPCCSRVFASYKDPSSPPGPLP